MTNRVVSERIELNASIKDLEQKIESRINKMDAIKKDRESLQDYVAQMEGNRNYEASVTEVQELPRGHYVTNCGRCNVTCHDNCAYGDGESKKHCSAMNSDGYCTVCSCHWSHHTSMTYKFVPVQRTKTRIVKELIEKYQAGKDGKDAILIALQNSEKECEKISDEIRN